MSLNYEKLEEKLNENGWKSPRPSLAGLQQVFEALQDLNFLALPSVPFQFKSKLPSASAVYVVYMDADVFYVGQSVDIQSRWGNHAVSEKLALVESLPTNPNLRVGWVNCPKHLLDFVEIYLIGLLQPVMNITHRDY